MTVKNPNDFPAAFAEAWITRDGNAIAALFVADADFVNVVGIWWEDQAAIAKAHDYALKSFFSETRLTPGRVKVRMLGDDHALVHARFRLIGQRARDGSAAGQRSTILTFVLKRDGAAWYAVSAQNTDIVPGAESFEATPTGLKPRDYRA